MISRCALVLTLLLAPLAHSAEPLLKDNNLLAICGDSITEQRKYSVFIEDYLLMCRPAASLRAVQFGWSGETAPHFLERMEFEVLRFSPNVATTCYGMNDGGYGPLTPEIADRYRNAQKAIIEKFIAAGVKPVLGSPGCVDSTTFRNDPKAAEIYNKTLGQLRDIDQALAKELNVPFADVYTPMIDAMAKAKTKYGPKYHLAGGDGVHPDNNGHLVMAYAFLKALGCDGDIGTITVDLAANKADATPGHKVLSVNAGTVEIESSRYPFCFFGDPANPSATTGVLEFLPFNQDLNRLRLIVNNPSADRLNITWGSTTKSFTKDQLAQGINLAAEFLDNPFCAQFQKVEELIRNKQGFEVPLVKSLLHGLFKVVPEQREQNEKTASAAMDKDKSMAAEAATAVTPITHTIRIEPAQ